MHWYVSVIWSRNNVFMIWSRCNAGLTWIVEHVSQLLSTSEVVLNAMPPLVPRYYSASSSPLVSKTRISFAFSVLEYCIGEGKRRRKREGVCTSWLESSCSSLLKSTEKTESPRIRMIRRLQSNNFRPPADTTKPLILIGPGTGVAPFIGFLQHRHARQEMNKKVEEDTCTGCWRGGFEIEEDCKTSSQQFGEIHLFFGCRHEKKDFLYREEMSRYLDSGILTKLYRLSPEIKRRKFMLPIEFESTERSWLKWFWVRMHVCTYVWRCEDGKWQSACPTFCWVTLLRWKIWQLPSCILFRTHMTKCVTDKHIHFIYSRKRVCTIYPSHEYTELQSSSSSWDPTTQVGCLYPALPWDLSVLSVHTTATPSNECLFKSNLLYFKRMLPSYSRLSCYFD